MAVIAFVNQKGGVAKSTSAVHFAYWLSQKRQKHVVVVDGDAQRSSSQWLAGMEMEETEIPCQVLSGPDALLEELPNLAEQYEYAIVDAPAGLAEETRAILFRCDLAVIPVQPSGVDLRSASDAMRLVKQAQSVRGGLPKAAAFLSRAVKGTRLKDEALSLLGKIERATLLQSVVHQRQVVADTSGQSATVWEMSGQPARDAAKEFETLFTEILSLL